MNNKLSLSPLEQAFSLRQRGQRDLAGLYLAEGIRSLCRARDFSIPILQVLLYPKELKSPRGQVLIRQLKRDGIPVTTIKEGPYRALTKSSQPQGVVSVLEQRWSDFSTTRPKRASNWLLLRHIRSSGNLGSMLRTAEATGISGVIFLGTQTDPYDAGTVRAAMGSLMSLKLLRGDHHEIAQWTFKHRCRVYGCSGEAEKAYHELSLSKRPTLLFLGEERRGLSERDAELCDDFISIPMTGRVDSLNVSVAAGIMLFEIFKRRGFPGVLDMDSSSHVR
ncbi:MAG: RNA methyltransferase [Planctomycetota bacterium]|nr:RNA methyltransferase [Planctomycetota bacterium]